MINFKKDVQVNFVECPFCGYNNYKERLNLYGTCLRCHSIIDKKIYLKRKLWESKTKYKVREENIGKWIS